MSTQAANWLGGRSLEGYEWRDGDWMRAGLRERAGAADQHLRMHPGSWRRDYGRTPQFLNWREIADERIPYLSTWVTPTSS